MLQSSKMAVFLLFCLLTACGGGAFEFSGFDNLGNNMPGKDDTKEPVAIHKPLFSSLSAGDRHSLAINEAGELYAWGLNYDRQLGDGTTSNKNWHFCK